jgi:hypothetical protein
MQHISTIDAEIISAYNLLLTKKSLMKTESLPTQKSSTQYICTTNAEIISTHNLLQTQRPRNHQRDPVILRLPLKSSVKSVSLPISGSDY